MPKEIHSAKRLLEVQKEIGAIKKDKQNPYFNSKYVDINGLLSVVKPILNKHGFILTQVINTTMGKTCITTGIIDSETGQFVIEGSFPLPDVPKAQEMGSAITYYRRYALQSMLALEAEDDDGNKASAKKPSTKPSWKHKPGCTGKLSQIDGVWKCSNPECVGF